MINDHNISFFDAVTTVEVFTLHMRYNFSKLELYICMINIVVSFWENKQNCPRLTYWQMLSLPGCLPPEIPRDVCFIQSILKRMLKWRVSWIRSIALEVNNEEKEVWRMEDVTNSGV